MLPRLPSIPFCTGLRTSSIASSCADLPPIGSPSFLVPPPWSRNYELNQLVKKLTNPLTEEESMSTTTVRGWPSSDYFIQEVISSKLRVSTEHIQNRGSFSNIRETR
ncbi:hypothetical protein UlMin_029880 [Ulmus minor]